MKLKTCFAVLAAISGTVCSFADESLLFRADFDGYTVTADESKGKRDSITFKNPSLQLRMWPGINQKGNALALEKSESCAYPMPGNFNPAQGTISFWVAPLNWKPSQPGFQWFFSATQRDFTLHIYKYTWANCLFFYIQSPKFPGTKKAMTASVFITDEAWKVNVWHKIDAVWDRNGMTLYVDGVVPKKHKWLNPVVKFSAPADFPAAASNGRIALNSQPSKDPKVKNLRTAFDNLRIYNRPLGAKEIYNEYAKYQTSKFGSKRETLLLPVPTAKKAVKLDGKIEAGEWSDASVAPIREAAPFSRDKDPAFHGKAYVKHDGKMLKIAMESSIPAKVKKWKNRDANLWEDDSMEIHLQHKDGTLHQFIINGNGAVFDKKITDVKWNANLRSAVYNTAKGWSAEMEIPFADLGGKPESGAFYLSAQKYKGAFSARGWNRAGGGGFIAPKTYGKFIWTDAVFGLDQTGNLALGEMAANVRATGVTVTAELVQENGTVVKANVKFPAEQWKKTLESGYQKLKLTAKKGGKTIGLYEHYFYVDSPVEIKYDSMPSKNKVVVTVNLNNAGKEVLGKIKTGLPGTISFIRKSDNKVMASHKVKAVKLITDFEIPLPKLEMGEYYIGASFGKAFNQVRFNVPDMRPFQLPKPGLDHTVPSPWFPVKIKDAKNYEVLGRVYTFGNGPFPVQTVSRGSNMLSAPPTLNVNGKPAVWNGFKRDDVKADRILFSGKGQAGPLTVHWNSELWFDGMYKVMFRTEGTGEIRNMTLTYSVPREFARYVFKQDYRYSLFSWKNDRIEKEFNPLKNRECTLQWTSGIEKGFAFAPESNKNWANKPGEKNIILTRNKKDVTVTAKIISRTVSVTKPLDYTFVFQATPSRRPHAMNRDINNGGYFVPTMQNLQFGGGGDHTFADYKTDGRWTSPASMRPLYPDRFAKYAKDYAKNRKIRKTKSRHALRGVNYCMPMHIGTNEAEYDYFIKEWITLPTCVWSYNEHGVPQTLFSTCGNTGATDVLIWNLEQFLKSGVSGGIYNDCAHTPACENPRHGHGGKDAFGQQFSTSSMLSQRDYFLREYRLIRKYDKFLFNHVPSADFVPFVHCFSDLIWPGEEFHQPVADHTEHCYIEFIPRESWQSAFNPTIRGVAISLLPQYDRAIRAMAKGKAERLKIKNNPEWAIRTMTPCLLHDTMVSAASINNKTVDRWWIIKEPMFLNEAEFRGYWFDDKIKSVTKDMLISYYILPKKAPYKYLIIAGNYNRDEKELGIEKLNLPHTAIRELWTGTDVKEKDLKSMKIPGNHFRIFGVK